jgi:Mg-chelatase subunit ChlD
MTPRAIRTAVAMLLQLGAAVLLALVALGRPWPADRGDALVFVLADRSASVATEQTSKAVADVADQVTQAGRTVVRTIEFAGRPEAPGSADVQSTDIEAAIDLALNRRSTTSRAAIVVVSDGNATGGDTRRALQSAADAGVPLLWRTVEPGAQSPHIAGVLAAGEASPGQAIPISVQIFGKVTRPMLIELSSRNGRAEPVVARIAPGTPGSVSLPVRAVSAGTLVLDATLRDESSSNIVDAWRDAVAIDVAAPAAILFVAAGPSVLARSLRDGGWTLDSVTPSGLDAKAGSLDRYAAVVLDDVPASAARPATWVALQGAVRDAGTGLLVLGGAHSFAAGSYGDSRLESLLPVLSRPSGLGDATALVFVVDKSGSMGATSAGVDRFRLAQRAVIETATMLTDRDSAALVAFDAEPRTLLPLQGAQAFREAVSRPWPAQPKGGTRIAPALEAAVAQLESAPAQRRIIVLVTDGFVDQQPDPALEARLTRARVELIALGVGPDADMAALARLVPPERGTILRVAEAAELPVMMRQGLENRRAPIERGRIAVRAEAPMPFQLSARTSWPMVAAYDVTTPAPRAIVHLESERGDPLIASARVGLGQVVAVTPGLGTWSPDWLRWRDWPELAGGLAEWVSSSGSSSGLPVAVTDLPRTLRVDVDVASDGRWSNAASGRVRVQHPSGRITDTPLEASAAGRLSAEIDEPEDGLYTISVIAPDAARRLVHLRAPRREFGGGRPNADIAEWVMAGLVREWSPAAFQAVLGGLPPAERSPDRAMIFALGLFLLGLLIDRR